MSSPSLLSRDSAESQTPVAEYDTPWKIAIEHYFEPFMAFYFPRAHAEIDWGIPYEFLDKELQKIAKDAVVGARFVDKLIKVTRRSGQENWLCIHLEVQVERQTHFAERMFVYHYRIYDRYRRPAASMALLGDDDLLFLPQTFAYEILDCEVAFRFPVAKLADYAQNLAMLEANPNPFALLTLAYLKNRATTSDMQSRFDVKCELIRVLHQRKWDKDMIRLFFKVIDWMMVLPPTLVLQLTQFVGDMEKEKEMEYITSVERIIIEQKQQESRQEGVQLGESAMLCRLLTRRFGSIPPSTQERIANALQSQIELWFDRAVDAVSLNDVFADAAH